MPFYILKNLNNGNKYICRTKYKKEKLLDIFHNGTKPLGGSHMTIDRSYITTPRTGYGWEIVEWMRYLPREIYHGKKTYKEWQREVQ
ncbi:hypothetical protein WKH56_20210 [Priestia sp. SB1]|uniref:hypothetical protein n=1 Tax=Priestia sp. SB1 TaxID=3132359 RepID=UPI003171A503